MIIRKDKHKQFYSELDRVRYHILSRELVRKGNYYPNTFPETADVDIESIVVGDKITVRAFFSFESDGVYRIDSGMLTLSVEDVNVEEQTLFANILTELPPHFALSRGTSIEIKIDEVLSVKKP